MGIKLMDNFKFPFHATSFSNLWSRWHISLMQWFRDYIMFPLIRKRWKWQTVFMVVFLVSGLWHGANWTFIIWGGINGVFVILSKSTIKLRARFMSFIKLDKLPKLRRTIQIAGLINMFALPSLFFRAKSLTEAKLILTRYSVGWSDLFRNLTLNIDGARQEILYLGKEFEPFIVIASMMLIFEIIQYNMSMSSVDSFFTTRSKWFRWCIYFFLTFAIILMSFIEKAPFIYFQF
jgi:D-alanyl-lipoteichoic acid acyltransferase DltB (MBOAT superfamily)